MPSRQRVRADGAFLATDAFCLFDLSIALSADAPAETPWMISDTVDAAPADMPAAANSGAHIMLS